ncbi:MAG: arylamine N-acetyltransferase [Pseudomonadota bacterium]
MATSLETRSAAQTVLRRDVCEATLDAFGYSAMPDPTLDTLNAVYKAWCRKVGYDNVLKRIYIETNAAGPFPVMDPNDYLESWMKHGTSGSCWPSSEALLGVLTHIGFRVERVAGQMLECNDPMNPNHGGLVVHLDGKRYHTDPSLGSEVALELIDGHATSTQSEAFGIWNTGDGHVWWRPGHSRRAIEIVFDLHDLSYDFFSYRYEKTKEFSLFNTTLYIRRNRDDEILTYGRGNMLRVDTAGELTATPIEPKDTLAFLVEDMGLSEEIVSQVPLQDVEGAKFE